MRYRRPSSCKFGCGRVAVDEAFKPLPFSWMGVAVSEIKLRRGCLRGCLCGGGRGCSRCCWPHRGGSNGLRQSRLRLCGLGLRRFGSCRAALRGLQSQGRDGIHHNLDLLSRSILLLQLSQDSNQGSQCGWGALGGRRFRKHGSLRGRWRLLQAVIA